MERLSRLYKQFVGSEPTEIVLMDKAGSNRQYYRMHGERSIVGVIGESREENDAFIYMARHFREQGLSVPEVYGVSEDHMAYIQEDLGKKPENCYAVPFATWWISNSVVPKALTMTTAIPPSALTSVPSSGT